MTERIDLAKAVEMHTQAEDMLLICHKNPDGDTLGSAGALLHALRAMGKRAAILCSAASLRCFRNMCALRLRFYAVRIWLWNCRWRVPLLQQRGLPAARCI